MEAIHIMMMITTITEMIPTAAPALKIPPITEQLLKHNSSKIAGKKCNFFMGRFYRGYNIKKAQLV